MKTLGWVVLFAMAWPIFILVWWVAPEKRPRFVQQVIDFARAHPKPCAWAGLVVGVLAFAGGISELISPDPNAPQSNPVGGLVFSVAIVAVCGFLLAQWRWQEIQTRNAEIAARADAQNLAVLQGEDWGVYGTKDMPTL